MKYILVSGHRSYIAFKRLAEYLGGLMDIVEGDMYNFVYGGEVE